SARHRLPICRPSCTRIRESLLQSVLTTWPFTFVYIDGRASLAPPISSLVQEDQIMSSWTSHRFLSPLIVVLFAGLLACGAEKETKPPAKPVDRPALDLRVTGPFTHENLTLFFIHGDDQIKGRKLLTLDEALEQKKVVVHETKEVNKLSIENVSDDEVFVQAGDIVKGGQQDRILAFDMIVPKKSGKVPID